MVTWKYFFMTIFIELPAVVIWLWPDWKKALLIGFLLNLFTWPLLLTVYGLTKWNILLLEFVVVFIEGLGYTIFFKKKLIICLLMSLIANGLSYYAGLFIFN